MATLEEIEALRRRTADALEDAEITDLEERIAEARQRTRSHQQRLLEAAETTARNTAPRRDRARMSVAEKSAYVAKYGREAYLALPNGRS